MATVIRAGRPADYGEVLAKLVHSFGIDAPWTPRFDDLYPDVIRPDEACMGSFRLAEVDGVIAAGIQIVPQTLVVAGDVTLKVGSLGQVFCLPEHRGQGLMSSLLPAVIELMEQLGCHLSLLNGERRRYRNYGWELAGTSRRLSLKGRPYVGEPPVPSASPSYQGGPRRWLGDGETALRIARAQDQLAYRELRTPETFPAVLRRRGVAVWTHEDAAGFAFTAWDGGTLVEWGGEPTTFEALLLAFLGKGDFRVDLPPVEAEGPLEKVLTRYAGWYQTVPTGQVRLFSLRRVLEAYRPEWALSLAGSSAQVVLRVAETGERLAWSAANLETLGGEGADTDLALSLASWSRLLFGPYQPEDLPPAWAKHELLRRALPLPIYWPTLSHV